MDKEACFSICAYSNEKEPCDDVHVTNNIAAGCPYAGFVAPGHACGDDESDLFKWNTAHSTLGAGMLIIPGDDPSHTAVCYEGSSLAVYKAQWGSIGTAYEAAEIRMRDVTVIDSKDGINIYASDKGDKFPTNKAVLINSHVYGETEADDCPEDHDCLCPQKMGVMLFYGQNGSKDYHHDVTSGYLTTNLMSYGSWASEAEYSGNTFHNFISNTTKCGNRQTLLRRNPDSSDYIPVQKFYNTIFDNVSDEAMVWLEDPDPHWANAADCAGFPCTAPNNVVMTFEGTSFTG